MPFNRYVEETGQSMDQLVVQARLARACESAIELQFRKLRAHGYLFVLTLVRSFAPANSGERLVIDQRGVDRATCRGRPHVPLSDITSTATPEDVKGAEQAFSGFGNSISWARRLHRPNSIRRTVKSRR